VEYIKIDLRERLGCMDWTDLVQDRKQRRALVNSVLNLWVPYSSKTDGFSRRIQLHKVGYSYSL
jgi:hypothetical protein